MEGTIVHHTRGGALSKWCLVWKVKHKAKVTKNISIFVVLAMSRKLIPSRRWPLRVHLPLMFRGGFGLSGCCLTCMEMSNIPVLRSCHLKHVLPYKRQENSHTLTVWTARHLFRAAQFDPLCAIMSQVTVDMVEKSQAKSTAMLLKEENLHLGDLDRLELIVSSNKTLTGSTSWRGKLTEENEKKEKETTFQKRFISVQIPSC